MEIGITLEQFNNLKENLRTFGISIYYDISFNEWIPVPYMLTGTILKNAGVPQEKWGEIVGRSLVEIGMIEDLRDYHKQLYPDNKVSFEDFLRELKEEELNFTKEEDDEEEEEE